MLFTRWRALHTSWKTKKNMESHLHRNVYDENPYTKNMESHLHIICMTNIHIQIPVPFFLFSTSITTELCFLNWFSTIVSIKRISSCQYNASRQLNVCWMKSKNIWLLFIVSSLWTSMSYFSLLRDILYYSNNSSLLAIIIHGLKFQMDSIF